VIDTITTHSGISTLEGSEGAGAEHTGPGKPIPQPDETGRKLPPSEWSA
jgi:hypothetical protein